ncbi:MAG: ATP-binding protein [Sterolibacteriaceae bacterium]|uniref:ATP-binding protein n=1 Tax=Sulfuritalea sp. TaxID=2480090 RepID=UPI001A4BACBC|nr:ATP-binding protein [Sulfuritalea sp.]MBL8479611.1 ATP-binding protein [Sterolibacteriaceae bacterium]MBN8475296.1 ATP-binding protein [Sulfuritalea sp.]
MIPRAAAALLDDIRSGYPVITLTGPRQSGKTTLARAAFPDKPYVSLETPDEREFAAGDPRGFLARWKEGAIIDEVQHVPALLSWIQSDVDAAGTMGRFVLTGSQNFALMAHITQSLAGRSALVQLLPLSIAELNAAGQLPNDLDAMLLRGGYPALYARPLNPARWLADYTMSYLERDVRQITQVHDLSAFQRFLRLCAGRTGQLLNLASLAQDTGVAQSTARAWLSVLEASYIVHLLQSHHRNLGKRVVKMPKLYFIDVALAVSMMGIQTTGQLAIHPLRGALFETLIVAEFLKARFNSGFPSNLYFWRDNVGLEVDLLIDEPEGLHPIEIKSSATVTDDLLKGLRKWLAVADGAARHPRLICAAPDSYTRSGIEVRRWQEAAA